MLHYKQHTQNIIKPTNPLNSDHSNSQSNSALATFQNTFAQYLRRQNKDDTPQFISTDVLNSSNNQYAENTTAHLSVSNTTRVTQLYQTLVFNNICGFLNQCFPVCQTLISVSHWQEICQQFLLNHSCHSPYFTEINQSFVDYLSQPKQLNHLELPPYFAELAHYEWIELLVETHPDTTLENRAGNESNDINCLLTINPTVQNLHYQWPVHTIGGESLPDSVEDSFFIVYRNNDKVEFMQTNALTHALIEFIQTKKSVQTTATDLTALLKQFAQMLGYEDQSTLVDFGLPLLEQLSQQGILLPNFKCL